MHVLVSCNSVITTNSHGDTPVQLLVFLESHTSAQDLLIANRSVVANVLKAETSFQEVNNTITSVG